jgi:hypothetical protein
VAAGAIMWTAIPRLMARAAAGAGRNRDSLLCGPPRSPTPRAPG